MNESTRECSGFFQTYFVESFWRKYSDFRSITSRRTFWLTVLAYFVLQLGVIGIAEIILAAGGAAGTIISDCLLVVFGFGMLIPGLAICCRRLRDAGLNPWLLLVSLIPVVGAIILLVLLCRPSERNFGEKHTKFGVNDWLITGGCLALVIVGTIMMVSWISSSGMLGYDDFNIDDDTEIVFDYDDYE